MKTSIKAALSVILITIFALGACRKSDDTVYTVQYKISSAANMNVDYTDKDGSTKSVSNVNSNWTYSFTTSGHGQIVKLNVTSVSATSVTAQILINGQQASQDVNDAGHATIQAQIP